MASTVSRQKLNYSKYSANFKTLKTSLRLEKYNHLKDTLIDINNFTNRRTKLRDFEYLTTLLGDGMLNNLTFPSEALIRLSNYLGLEHADNLSSLTLAWNKFILADSITGESFENWNLQRLGIGQEWEGQRSTILELLGDTGLLTPRYPRYSVYDSLIIHETRLEDIMLRLRFIAELWQRDVRFKQVIVLTSERKLSAYELDQKNWQFLPFKQTHSNNIWTETDLLKYAWQVNNVIPPEVRQLPVTWLETNSLSEEHDWGRCIAVANAPAILRQHVLFERKLYENKSNTSIETVGSGQEENNLLIACYLREMACLLSEFNSFVDVFSSSK